MSRNPLADLNSRDAALPSSPKTGTPSRRQRVAEPMNLGTSPVPLRFSTDPMMATSPRSTAAHRGILDMGSPLAFPSSAATPRRATRVSQSTMSTPRSGRTDLRVPGLFDMNALSMGSETQQTGTQQTEGEAVKTVIWGTDVNIQESMNMFRNFLSGFTMGTKLRSQGMDVVDPKDDEPYYPQLFAQLREEERYAVNLDCANLKMYEPAVKLYHQLCRFPQEIIPVMDFTATQLFMEMFPEVDMQDTGLIIRPFNLERQVNMRQLNPEDIDQLITVKGLMIRASALLPDMKKGFFRCTVCEQTTTSPIDRGRIMEPTRCPNDSCRAQFTMRLVHNRCEFANKQVARMQETPDETPDGQTPYTLSMYLYDDLVDVAKPGDKLEITGIFRAVPVRVNPRRRSVKAQFKTYLDVVHIRRSFDHTLSLDKRISESEANKTEYVESDRNVAFTPEEEEEFKTFSRQSGVYEVLANSIAPSIFGMEDVKKGVLLQLFGGSSAEKDTGLPVSNGGLPRIRGDINVLLVGDPGLAKSQLLKYVHSVAPRGIYTSGKGSSAVGLTAYVTRDPDSNQLVLESGALVLSDGGVCCIDEFDKMSEHTRSILHEVMEQQTISIAKAGIITTLNARTSILASANPIKSKFDVRLSIVENINIPPPLLSRFDLLYLVLDKPNEQDDRWLAQHLMGLYMGETIEGGRVQESRIVPKSFFAKYVNYARSLGAPEISDEAGQCLVDYYVNMRKWGRDGNRQSKVVTATTRQLESMIRLSQAHAKMRLSRKVEPEDVVEAHRLISSAMQKTCIDPLTGRLDLDMITTGHSARSVQQQAAYRKHVLEMLRQTEGGARLADLYAQFADKVKKISEAEFSGIVDGLALEQSVMVKGRTFGDKTVSLKSF